MEAIIAKISFFEAFFKVHYTKGFKLTYPVPLPTSVAGMFGAMLGIERGDDGEFYNFLFGAKILRYDGIAHENATFIQYKGTGPELGVASLSFINNPTYLIALGGDKQKIDTLLSKLQASVKYLPYGGQNDFFVKDWKFLGTDSIEDNDEITNYAPQDWVEPAISGDLTMQILPVMHSLSSNPNFYFLTKGKLKLRNKIPCTKKEKIGLYDLSGFKLL